MDLFDTDRKNVYTEYLIDNFINRLSGLQDELGVEIDTYGNPSKVKYFKVIRRVSASPHVETYAVEFGKQAKEAKLITSKGYLLVGSLDVDAVAVSVPVGTFMPMKGRQGWLVRGRSSRGIDWRTDTPQVDKTFDLSKYRPGQVIFSESLLGTKHAYTYENLLRVTKAPYIYDDGFFTLSAMRELQKFVSKRHPFAALRPIVTFSKRISRRWDLYPKNYEIINSCGYTALFTDGKGTFDIKGTFLFGYSVKRSSFQDILSTLESTHRWKVTPEGVLIPKSEGGINGAMNVVDFIGFGSKLIP
ncbi:unnamed protein product [Sphagnum balticum]